MVQRKRGQKLKEIQIDRVRVDKVTERGSYNDPGVHISFLALLLDLYLI